jgi:hypothetical protein
MRLIIAPRSTAAQHRPAEWGRLRCETINLPQDDNSHAKVQNVPGDSWVGYRASCPLRKVPHIQDASTPLCVARKNISGRNRRPHSESGNVVKEQSVRLLGRIASEIVAGDSAHYCFSIAKGYAISGPLFWLITNLPSPCNKALAGTSKIKIEPSGEVKGRMWS